MQSSLGAVVRNFRLELGITQEELAWRARLHRTYVADIERGARNPTLRTVVCIAAALEVSLTSLLSSATALAERHSRGTAEGTKPLRPSNQRPRGRPAVRLPLRRTKAKATSFS